MCFLVVDLLLAPLPLGQLFVFPAVEFAVKRDWCTMQFWNE